MGHTITLKKTKTITENITKIEEETPILVQYVYLTSELHNQCRDLTLVGGVKVQVNTLNVSLLSKRRAKSKPMR